MLADLLVGSLASLLYPAFSVCTTYRRCLRGGQPDVLTAKGVMIFMQDV